MSVVYVLLPLSLVMAGVAVGVFYWAARSGQLDDLETPALRMLADDVELRAPGASRESKE
jgi:cbb3-type cytochrome oxidase maturation protein